MNKKEKYINIFLKFCGIYYLLNAILCSLNKYQPDKTSIIINMIIIGIFGLTMKYSSNKKDKKEN